MKMKTASVFMALFIIACSKENNTSTLQTTALDEAVAADIPIPINDLGTGIFKGYVGGLYPGGANTPSGTYATDLLNISNTIVPLDSFGVPKTNGKITFISLGGSTGGKNMKQLKAKTTGNPLTNPKLQVLNCNNGSGQGSLNSIINPDDAYWAHVTQILKGSKSSYRQVQVIYLETDDSIRNTTWPGRPNQVKTILQAGLRAIKIKFPNIKVVYLLGRTKTFGNLAFPNKEPMPYYFGWACKWVIEDQINGVPGTQYKGAEAVAPIAAWGFYQWADSLPRTTDGFYWRQSFTKDGMHAKQPPYQDTLALRFQKFLLTDANARIWYARP